MKGRLSPRLTAGLLTLAIWALVAGSALFWALRLGSGPQRPDAAVAGGPPPGGMMVDTPAVARARGAVDAPAAAAAPAPDVVARLALRGIVTHGGRGAALIAIDGKPARPLRVGATLDGVEGGWTVRSVTPRAVVLAADGREARLEMPPLAQRSSAGDAVAPTRPAPGPEPFTPAVGTMPPPTAAPAQMTPPQIGGALQPPQATPAPPRPPGG